MTTTRGTTTNDGAVSIAATLTPMLLTPEQAAHVLGIGRTSVYALLRKGELGSVRLGRSRRIPYRSLVEFIDRKAGRRAISSWHDFTEHASNRLLHVPGEGGGESDHL